MVSQVLFAVTLMLDTAVQAGLLVLQTSPQVAEAVAARFMKAVPSPGTLYIVATEADAELAMKPWKNAQRIAPNNQAPIPKDAAIWVAVPTLDPQSAFARELLAAHRRGQPIGGWPVLPYLPNVQIVPAPLPNMPAIEPASGQAILALSGTITVVVNGRDIRAVGDGTLTLHMAPGNRRDALCEVMHMGDVEQIRRAAQSRAAEPFPATELPVPNVKNGTLFIVGGGGMPAGLWKRFIERAGGPDALIVVIPTGNEDPLPAVIGEVRGLERAGAKNVKILHTRSRDEANREEFSAILQKAGGVWFSGGRQWRFVDAYEDTLTLKRFHEVLQRGGAIGGSSAGASIQSEYMPRGHPLGNMVMMTEGYERGFAFLPGVAVDQHFIARRRQQDLKAVIEQRNQLIGVGIDEATAIEVRGSEFEVIGASKVIVMQCAPMKANRVRSKEVTQQELNAGQRYDFSTRMIKEMQSER